MRGALQGQYITVVSTKGRRSEIALAPLTKIGWITVLGNVQTAAGSPSILEMVVDGVARTFSKRPKQFNFPVLDSRSRNARSSQPHDMAEKSEVATFGELPFETRTWAILSEKQLGTSDELSDILDLHFLQLASQLDDLRAAIDIAITSQSWYLGEQNGRRAFHAPQCSTSLNESIDLVGVRTLRHCGINPDSVNYELKIGIVIADRLALLRLKPRTLQECAINLGLTRERVRQISRKVKWTPSQRRWPQPKVLMDLCTSTAANQRLQGSRFVESQVSNDQDSIIGKLTTSDVANILVSLGAKRRDVDPIGTRARNISALNITRANLQRRAYNFTERLGFITRAELSKHFFDEFPDFLTHSTRAVGENQPSGQPDSNDAISDLIAEVCAPYHFSYGYLYVNWQRGTYFSNRVEQLLRCFGPLPFEEVYLAVQRFCVVQIPRIVFPPRVVIREFLQQSPDFGLEDDEVSLNGGKLAELQGRQKWMYDQISSCTGKVIHRAKLYELARQSGVPFGTIAVYCSYSLYFKPIGHNCVTITGHTPSDAAIDLARDIGRAITVGSETQGWRVEGTRVIVDLSLGTDISHNGVWSPKVNIRNLIHGRRFKVFVGESQYGHASWSGNVLAGFVSGFQILGARLGDLVQMSFDTSTEVLELSFLSGA